ncbi:MAG: hypothetical protein D6835_05210 [Candidatus Thermofonsia bacterium]|nr:MAG: hypothetical protein D6835_05210 [Candidatus Thermofonsia bacterium]
MRHGFGVGVTVAVGVLVSVGGTPIVGDEVGVGVNVGDGVTPGVGSGGSAGGTPCPWLLLPNDPKLSFVIVTCPNTGTDDTIELRIGVTIGTR